MTRSERMTPVAKIADNKERNAAKTFGKSQKDLETHEKRLEELIQYRDEYNQRFKESGGNGLDAMKVNEYRIFLSRLNEAVSNQYEVVARVTRECAELKEGWMQTRSRAKALEKVVERYQVQEGKEQERQEQKESDERSLRITSTLTDSYPTGS